VLIRIITPSNLCTFVWSVWYAWYSRLISWYVHCFIPSLFSISGTQLRMFIQEYTCHSYLVDLCCDTKGIPLCYVLWFQCLTSFCIISFAFVSGFHICYARDCLEFSQFSNSQYLFHVIVSDAWFPRMCCFAIIRPPHKGSLSP
jgi:hypothetical protein